MFGKYYWKWLKDFDEKSFYYCLSKIKRLIKGNCGIQTRDPWSTRTATITTTPRHTTQKYLGSCTRPSFYFVFKKGTFWQYICMLSSVSSVNLRYRSTLYMISCRSISCRSNKPRFWCQWRATLNYVRWVYTIQHLYYFHWRDWRHLI